MKPTVGRVVLYTNLGDADGKYPPEQQAAIITKVKEKAPVNSPSWDTESIKSQEQDESRYAVSLHIFYETGGFWMIDVPFSAAFKKGHWTWPPRV